MADWQKGCRAMEITGAELFVKALKAEGVEMLFGYPGGQALDLFDALYDAREIEVILPRHEQAAAHAADGYARTAGESLAGNGFPVKWRKISAKYLEIV